MTYQKIDKNKIPKNFPTHKHPPEFWEALGRVIATFGFLEYVLLMAISKYTKNDIEGWGKKMEKSISDPLAPLIKSYEKVVKEHPNSKIINFDDFIHKLWKAKEVRDVLCHATWNLPNNKGYSVPFFINRRKERFDTPVDLIFLEKTQKHVAELTCEVISSITIMGWSFEGH